MTSYNCSSCPPSLLPMTQLLPLQHPGLITLCLCIYMLCVNNTYVYFYRDIDVCLYVWFFNCRFFMSGGHRYVCVLPWGRVLCPLRAAAKSPLTPPEVGKVWLVLFPPPDSAVSCHGRKPQMRNDLQIKQKWQLIPKIPKLQKYLETNDCDLSFPICLCTAGDDTTVTCQVFGYTKKTLTLVDQEISHLFLMSFYFPLPLAQLFMFLRNLLVFPNISMPLQAQVLGVRSRRHSNDVCCTSRKSMAGFPSLQQINCRPKPVRLQVILFSSSSF